MINVTLGEAKQQEKPFPKLMKSTKNGSIVYFTEKGYGLVIVEGKSDTSYTYAYGWDMDSFTDYNEPITLQNA